MKKKTKLGQALIKGMKEIVAAEKKLMNDTFELDRKTWLQPRLRRLSYQWPARNEAKKRARVSRGHYRCEACNNIFGPKEVSLDHINPVIPVNIPFEHLPLNIYVTNLFCDEDGFQVLCEKDHNAKTLQENTLRQQWAEKQKYIIYKTTNKINRKIYVGIHKCIDYDDNYLGSGKLLKLAIKKYGTQAFEREILFCFDNLEDALAMENEIVNDDFLSNDDVYNLVLGGQSYNTSPASTNKKRIVCHQTGEIFESIGDAAKWLNIDHASISKVVNDPNHPVRNFHFFTTDIYDSSIKVSFPKYENLRRVVHLNDRTTYPSIIELCNKLNLNYKSVRNALCIRDDQGISRYSNHFFMYEESFDPSEPIEIIESKIYCVEKDVLFDTCVEAAKFLKKDNTVSAGIAIAKAVRENSKMYGFHWKSITKKIIL